ncbi:MAG: hypothetical protein A3K19_01115 [Lentisphaerae bacterium RIFOXYB12_FULL_65_16]|nr:MAG: hypothetical protein A3K18_21810 [Lentisphaerae bacterium RIFOXYA12_64_32]OGV93731.1 MAG: hypothetical protein A3K19_01115 [Lentisphaerae bacterium RIFOXYB12_FULL_65_16]
MNVNKPYDRKVIMGIARYVRTAGNWSLYVEDEPLAKMPSPKQWRGDGIIADFDDVRVVRAICGLGIPVVGIGGGYGGYEPHSRVPYLATDNDAIARLAVEHFRVRGHRNFAYCGFPRTGINRWSEERLDAFVRHLAAAGLVCSTFVGRHATARRWEALQSDLTAWIRGLPKPVALMACSDARARHVLEACRRIGACVPDEVAVIGVDNDELMCELAIPPLSSVIQGTDRLGYEAAELLDQLMSGEKPACRRRVIEPLGIATRQSTDTLAITDAHLSEVIRYVRDHACTGLTVPDVAKAVHMARSTLEKRFQRGLGRSVHAEIERVRLQRLRELLQGTDLSLKEISDRTGFSTVQYMTHVFRRLTGTTPAQYRRANRP